MEKNLAYSFKISQKNKKQLQGNLCSCYSWNIKEANIILKCVFFFLNSS